MGVNDDLYGGCHLQLVIVKACSHGPISRIQLLVLKIGPCSHGNDIVPLSYRSDFWNGKVDCSQGYGPLSYQFWDLFMRVRDPTVP